MNQKVFSDVSAQMFAPYAEWSLSNNSVNGNPFALEATATFTHTDSGETRKIGMFYNGDGSYSFRFSGVEAGEWTFTTSSTDGDLNGYSGRVYVAEDSEARGFTVAQNGKFAQQLGDGSVQAILPNYAMLPSFDEGVDNYLKSDGSVNVAYIDDLIQTFIVQHGFTGLHMPSIAGNFFDIEGDSSVSGGSSYDPDPRTFAVLEELISRTHEAGGLVHIWAWGDSQRGWSADELPGGENGVIHQQLFEYIDNRLGSLPGWTLGQGFDNFEWSSPNDAAEANALFNDGIGYDHLTSVRPIPTSSDSDNSKATAWSAGQSIASIEDVTPGYEDFARAFGGGNGSGNPDGKPVFFEDRYRDLVDDGNKRNFEQDQQVDLLWEGVMAGGVASIWGNLEGATTYSSVSYDYDIQSQIRTWNTFFLEKERFHIDSEIANQFTGGPVNEQYALYSETAGEIVIYAEDTNKVTLNLASIAGTRAWGSEASLKAVNTEGAYAEINLGKVALINQVVTLATSSDWALVVTAVEPTPTPEPTSPPTPEPTPAPEPAPTPIPDDAIIGSASDGTLPQSGLVWQDLDGVSFGDVGDRTQVNDSDAEGRTHALAFETGSDVASTQVVYEQGGTVRGLNLFVENGTLYTGLWNKAEEDWGYKELSANIAANTQYSSVLVMDGQLSSDGTATLYLNGVAVDTVGGVGKLYAHSDNIGVGQIAQNTLVRDSVQSAERQFEGRIDKLAHYDTALNGSDLQSLNAFFAYTDTDVVVEEPVPEDSTADANGNLSVDGPSKAITVDGAASVPILLSGLDNDATAVISVSDGTSSVTSPEVNSNGEVVLDLTGLSTGTLALSVSVTDDSGNNLTIEGPSLALKAAETVDTADPVEATDPLVSLEDAVTGSDDGDYVNGTAGADVLNGLGGDDIMRGYEGDDILVPGAGSDKLSGGLGADMFVFDLASLDGNSNDIKDFSLTEGDAIYLQDLLPETMNAGDLGNFVRFTDSGTISVLEVDISGNGDGFTELAIIRYGRGLTLEDMIVEDALLF